VGRVIKTIEVEGQSAVALFDTGAVYTYIVERLLEGVPRKAVAGPVRVVLGGRVIVIQEVCTVDGKVEGLDFFTETVPVQALGMADGRELDAIIGARTMEQWEIRIDPKRGTLDLEGLRRREFTEFSEAECAGTLESGF